MADNSAAIEESEQMTGPDLDATLVEALKDIESRDDETPVEPEQPEEPVEEQPEEAPQASEEPEQVEPEEVAGEEPERQAKHPPSSWSAKAKGEFTKLPDHIQDEVLKREDDFHKGLEQYKQSAQMGDRMNQIIQPYQPYLRSKGATPEQTVASMLQTAYTLENASAQDKPKLLAQVAQKFGVDLSQLNSQQNEQQVDPYVQQLEQRVNQFEQYLQNQASTAQQQSMSEAHSEIDAFRNEVDESGNIKHLYFDDVRDDMANMIEASEKSGKKLSLQDAYDAAVWARPDIRENLLAEQQRQADEKRRQEQARKAEEAKKRGSVNVSTTGTYNNAETSPPGSIEDTLRQKYEEIQSRSE